MAGRSYLLWLLVASFPVLVLVAYQSGVRSSNPPPQKIDKSKIAVVFAGLAAYAHLEKIQPLAAGMVEAGYPVTFVTGEEFREFGQATGARFEALDGPFGMATKEDFEAFFANPGDGESPIASTVFVSYMREHLATIQRIFDQLRAKHEKIVYIHDISFLALLPVQLGAPGLLPTVSMGLGIAPIPLDSDYTYPFPATRVPNTSNNAIRLHRQAYLEMNNPIRLALDKSLATKLKEMDAIEPFPNFYHGMCAKDDYLLQLGLPEFEFQRPDIMPRLQFLGLPGKPGGSRELPVWWQDVVDADHAGKKIVVVSQGNAAPDLTWLLIPTLKALGDRDDLLLIGTTVTQGPEIEGFTVPANTRLAQFVPYDQLLPKASLLISTGGYGTVLQSIRAGTPMVLAGVLQDKAHVATIAEHVGIAVNLMTDHPTIDAIRTAAVKIIGDKQHAFNTTFRSNIQKLQEASKMYDPVKILDRTILEAVASSSL